MNRAARISTLLSLLLLGAAACGPVEWEAAEEGFLGDGKMDSSVEATFLLFEFDGELLCDGTWNVRGRIEDQLLYTIGHLNGDRSVGRLDQVELTEIRTEHEGDRVRVTYHAVLPVAWGRQGDAPTSYTFRLPREATYSGFQRFTESYMESCVDWSAHDVDSGSMWYYYRPDASRCDLDEADVVTTVAAVTASPAETTGVFPEYHKVWEDGVLRVVAVFGKYEDGATTSADAGIRAYNEFVRRLRQELHALPVTEIPPNVPADPGVDYPDLTIEADLGEGLRVEVVALLVDNVRTAGAQFDERYEALTPAADLIAYNGHSGLGANVRALARKGRWVTGQYVVVFLNGCDTYAYIDSSLAEAHMRVNPDDATGSKYLDVVTNAMPAYFASDAEATMALVRGLLAHDSPLTYEEIFESVDRSQVVLVTGEQDNVFRPGASGEWEGMQESGTVERGLQHDYETPLLGPGRYVFAITGTNDADLYVRVGQAPTTSAFDCRPFLGGSDERCTVDLDAEAAIFVAVRGYAGSSRYELTGYQEAGSPPPSDLLLDEAGTVARDEELRYETPPLAAGRYAVEMTGTGDADLYVRAGEAPTLSTYDCRPYRSDSAENCAIDVEEGTVLHVMVRGYAGSSDFHVVAM